MNKFSEFENQEIFIETSAYRVIRGKAKMAEASASVLRIVGKAGIGKTSALKQLRHEFPRSVYVEMSQVTKTCNGMLKEILETLHLTSSGTGKEQFVRLLEHTNSIDQPVRFVLIVDEAQKLEITAFRQLLNLQEQSQCCLIVSGNENLAASTDKSVTPEEITSRVRFQSMITEPTQDDCFNIARAHLVKDAGALQLCASVGRKLSLRRLNHLLSVARMCADQPDKEITLKAIKEAAFEVLGLPKNAINNLINSAKRG